jgi:hypothetical protein
MPNSIPTVDSLELSVIIRTHMRAKEFDEAEVEQLQAEADKYLEEAEAPHEEGKRWVDDAEKLRLLFKAQFYLTAVARKRDDKTSRRDLILEVVVIALISVEIILSLIFGLQGLSEGRRQADLLDKMRTSAAATADAMNSVKASLRQLADDQAVSRKNLEQMNDEFQKSLITNRGMASALRAQLTLLREEQKSRALQLSRKPKLALYIGGVPADATLKVAFTAHQITDTSVSYDCSFNNEGDATATKPLLRVIVSDKRVSLTSSEHVEMTNEPEDSPTRTFIIRFDNLRPRIRIPLVLTFVFPKGGKPFEVLLNTDADEIETGTRVGGILITPRKPVD